MIKKLLIVFLFIILICKINVYAQENENTGYIKDVRTDSILKEENGKTKFYSSIYLIDGTEKTWCPESTQDGSGGRIWIDFNKEIEVDKLFIKNGFGNIEYFNLNNRVKELKIESYSTISNKTSTDPYTEIFISKLTDTSGVQEVIFPQKIKTQSLRLTIISVYKGTAYNDTCISEISLRKITVKNYDHTPVIKEKNFTVKNERLSFTLYADGHVEDNGSFYGGQIDTPFVRGEWGFTNDGLIFVNIVKEGYNPDMSYDGPRKMYLFNDSYIFTKDCIK